MVSQDAGCRDPIAETSAVALFAAGAIFVVAATAGLIRALVVVGAPAFRSNAHAFLLVFSVTALALAFLQLLLYCVLVSSHQMWTIT